MELSKEQVEARFGFTRPDEAAECWDGVTEVDGLYQALWACVPKYEAPAPEFSEEPCYGMDSIARFWGEFSPEHQAALVRLDDENSPQTADDVVGSVVSDRFMAADYEVG
jgi:hypothetical protein